MINATISDKLQNLLEIIAERDLALNISITSRISLSLRRLSDKIGITRKQLNLGGWNIRTMFSIISSRPEDLKTLTVHA